VIDRATTVLTEVCPVEIKVPRDWNGSFEPVIIPKRMRRLDGIDQIVLSLSARNCLRVTSLRIPPR
jgi:putative transposase